MSSVILEWTIDDTDNTDIDTILLQRYLKAHKPHDWETDRSSLASMAKLVLDGHPEALKLKERVADTIIWQENMNDRVEDLLDHLMKEGLITKKVEPKEAQRAMGQTYNMFLDPIMERLYTIPEIQGLDVSTWDGYLDVPFSEPYERLGWVLAYNWSFWSYIGEVAIVEFLRQSPVW